MICTGKLAGKTPV